MKYGMTAERHARLVCLSEQMGVAFGDLSLLDEALTHPSYTNEAKVAMPHNERLEFLGDAVLELASSTYLYAHFPACSEGELTKMRASLVQSETLARLARRLDLGGYLRFGRGELHNGGADRQNNLENAFEAVIGAVYLDGGWEAAQDYVTRQLAAEVQLVQRTHVMRDYKTTLQEVVQKHVDSKIAYELLTETGPDHDKTFEFAVRINDAVYGTGKGRNKKEAEQGAAREALRKMKKL